MGKAISRLCYLCEWELASKVSPRKWTMCTSCQLKLSLHIREHGKEQEYVQVLELYRTMYQAGEVRKDANVDRAERFREFIISAPTPAQEIKKLTRLLDLVEVNAEELNRDYFTMDHTGRLTAGKIERREPYETVGRVHKRGKTVGLARDRQAETDLPASEGFASGETEQDRKDVFDISDIGVSEI